MTTSGALSTESLRAWLSLAGDAARQAGRYLAQAQTAEIIVTADAGRDVKLQADWRSEELIIQVLRERSGLAILTEERGVVEGLEARPGLQWIVDPLDGSFNYLRGIPFCCVSIGLWQEREPLLGAIYDFNRDELFTAIVGVGAWLNTKPIMVSSTAQRAQSVICTGFPVSMDLSSVALREFIALAGQYKKVRLIGSAALSLAYVASGRADVYLERDIKVWDVAAGLAIVRAAGGRLVQTASEKPQALTVYAGNASLPVQACE